MIRIMGELDQDEVDRIRKDYEEQFKGPGKEWKVMQFNQENKNQGDVVTTFPGLPVMEVSCESCKGTGGLMEFGLYDWYKVTCSNCNGKGVVLTEFGKQLIKFIKTHIQVRAGVDLL